MPKGQFVLGYKGIYFIVALFFLTFIFLFIYNAFLDYHTEKVQCTDTALEEIMIAKFLYGGCFTYVDPEVNRALPGTLDIHKFTQETLEQCFICRKRYTNPSRRKNNWGSNSKSYSNK